MVRPGYRGSVICFVFIPVFLRFEASLLLDFWPFFPYHWTCKAQCYRRRKNNEPKYDNRPGDLHLNDNLTRAEMAVLVSQICINPEHIAWERDFYARLCDANFNDVPKWARTYVGVCASNGIMAGYGEGIFSPSDPATPQMACAVILRWLERDGWDYDTACDKAAELELIPAEALTGDTITRGDMAILIKRAQDYMAWLQTL